MSFKEWKKWFKELPWSCRWFVLFILIRPVTDNFYDLKEISPMYSPLYIMGVLTVVFVLMSFFSPQFPRTVFSAINIPMRWLSFLIFFNVIFLLVFYFSLDVVGESIKCITPVLLFFYLRHFIRSQRDLLGIMQAFLYSCIFPFGVLLYENIFDPIAIEYVSEGRGGGSRIRGGYADVMSYAIFITGFFLITSYYYLLKIYDGTVRNMNLKKMLLSSGLCLLGLISIKQVSTWAVVIVLLLLLLLYTVRNSKGFILSFLVVLLILPFVAGKIYDTQIQPLVQKEVAVANGETDVEYALNGRVGRWERYLGIWAETPLIARLAGVSFSGVEESPVMIGGGIHNDFIRVMFLSGIIGLSLYFIFLFMVLRSLRKARLPERFLIAGSVACILLHSMSALPLLYASYSYLLMSVFAFAALPYSVKYGVQQKKGNSEFPEIKFSSAEVTA